MNLCLPYWKSLGILCGLESDHAESCKSKKNKQLKVFKTSEKYLIVKCKLYVDCGKFLCRISHNNVYAFTYIIGMQYHEMFTTLFSSSHTYCIYTVSGKKRGQ